MLVKGPRESGIYIALEKHSAIIRIFEKIHSHNMTDDNMFSANPYQKIFLLTYISNRKLYTSV